MRGNKGLALPKKMRGNLLFSRNLDGKARPFLLIAAKAVLNSFLCLIFLLPNLV